MKRLIASSNYGLPWEEDSVIAEIQDKDVEFIQQVIDTYNKSGDHAAYLKIVDDDYELYTVV